MAKSVGYLARATKCKRTPEEIRPAPNIAAIDFGSSSVSLAYSINGNREVKTLKLHSDYERVPNAILIRKENAGQCRVEQFGQNAQERYDRLSQSQKDQYIYFERIKILLERSDVSRLYSRYMYLIIESDYETVKYFHYQTIHRKTIVWSLTGGSYYLVEVIAFIIKYLKECLLRQLHVSGGINAYQSTDFDWVVTVPAIWKANAKRMMREASYMAGLTSNDAAINNFTPIGEEVPRPQEINPEKLLLALEPEAAAIHTQYHNNMEESQVPPQRYMVVDIGGGTVDITVHDQRDGKVDVLLPPIGNLWGGNTVNQAYESLLENMLNDREFQKYSRKRPDDITAINNLVYVEFEKEKKIFGNAAKISPADSIGIPLPTAVANFYGERKVNKAAKLIEAEYENNKLFINYDTVEEKIFRTTVDHILLLVEKALKELSVRIDTIYLVGGFGGCEYMYSALQSALASYKGKYYDDIVRPHLPHLAVVKGAVIWRQNPWLIQSRRADATYGLNVCLKFDESKHDEHYKICNEDQVQCCNNIFNVFIEKGELSMIDDIYTMEVLPPHQNDVEVKILIYSTSHVGVQYTVDKSGEPTVKEVGRLLLEVPNPDHKKREERLIEVSMSFSGTEIRAKAKYSITGEEVKIVCDFLSHQD